MHITCPCHTLPSPSSPKKPVQTPYEMPSYTSEHYSAPPSFASCCNFYLRLATVFFFRSHALHASAFHRYVSPSYRPNTNINRCITTHPELTLHTVFGPSPGLADEALIHRTKAASTCATARTNIAWQATPPYPLRRVDLLQNHLIEHARHVVHPSLRI